MQKFLVVLLLIFFTYAVYPQQELTLKDAISIALQRNTDLQRSANSIKSYKTNVLSAYGNFLPSLSANGNYNWSKSIIKEGTVQNFGGGVINVGAITTTNETYTAGVNSSLTLFDGLSSFANLSKSKNDLEAARLNLERMKQDVVFQTISLYYDVINSGQLLKVKGDDLTWNQKNLETINERNKLGAVTMADVYKQQVQVGNAELALVQAKNDFETAKSNLLYYLGLDVLKNYAFTDTLTMNEENILNEKISSNYNDIKDLVDQALNSRPDYAGAKLSLESANNNVTMSKSGYYPSLTGNFGFNSNSNKFSRLFKDKYYQIGISLHVPIFSGFSVVNQVQFAEVGAMNQELTVTDLERTIKQNIQKTFLDIQAAEKNLEVSQSNVKASEENRKIEQEKYALGSGTLLDLLIANSDYTTAKQTFINAQFNYIKLSEQLKYYLGVLDYKKFESD